MTKEELEKEAKEYAEQCYGWTNNDLALDVAQATYITSAEPREKRIAELENDMKTAIPLLERSVEISESLIKAKELLKRFIELENCTLDYDDIKEAEHFISEVEK